MKSAYDVFISIIGGVIFAGEISVPILGAIAIFQQISIKDKRHELSRFEGVMLFVTAVILAGYGVTKAESYIEEFSFSITSVAGIVFLILCGITAFHIIRDYVRKDCNGKT